MASVGDIVGIVIFLIAIIGCAGLVGLIRKIYTLLTKTNTGRHKAVASQEKKTANSNGLKSKVITSQEREVYKYNGRPGSTSNEDHTCPHIQVLEELLSRRQLHRSDLQRQCDRELFLHLAKHIASYRNIARHLGLTEPDIAAVMSDEPNEAERRVAVLIKWQEKSGADATYVALAEHFLEMESRALAEEVIEYHVAHPPQSQVYPEKVYPDWDKFDEGKRKEIKTELLLEYSKVSDAYSNLVLRIAMSFEERNIKPQHVKLKLETYITAHCSRDATSTGLNEVSNDVYEVFRYIGKHTSWVNYQLLEIVVNQFGNEEEKQLLESYRKEHVIPYIKRPLFEVPSRAFITKPISESIQLSLIIQDDIMLSVEEAITIEQKLAKFLKLPSLQIVGYQPGSIELIFSLSKANYDSNSMLEQRMKWEEKSQSYKISDDITTILLSDVDNQEGQVTLVSKILQCRQEKTNQLLEETRAMEKELSTERENYQTEIQHLMNQIQNSTDQKEKNLSYDIKTGETHEDQPNFGVPKHRDTASEEDSTLQLSIAQTQTIISPTKDYGSETEETRQNILHRQQKEMQTEYDRRISDLESQSIQEKEQLAKEIQKLEQHLHLEKNRHQMLTQKFHQLEQTLQQKLHHIDTLATTITEKDSMVQELRISHQEQIEEMQAKYDRRIHDLKNQDKEQLAKEIQKLEHCLQSEKDRYQTLIQKLQQLEQTLKEKLHHIDTLATTITEKDCMVQELRISHQEEMEEKDKHIQELQQEIKEETTKGKAIAFGKEVHILMVGKAGVGKSSLASAMLGEETHKEEFRSLQSDLVNIKCSTCTYAGITVHVYDTRGLFDGVMEVDDVLEEIQLAKPRSDYDAVVVCMKLYDRFDQSHLEIFHAISKLHIRSDTWSRVYIALTNSDDIPKVLKSQETINENAQQTTSQYKEAIKIYLKKLDVHIDLPIYNTTLIEITSRKKILNNWLPCFMLGILYQSRLLSLQMTLSVLQDHPRTGQAIEKAIAKVHGQYCQPSLWATKVRTTASMLQDIASKGDPIYEALLKALQDN